MTSPAGVELAIQVLASEGQHDVALTLADGGVTVAEVLEALDLPAQGTRIDDRSVAEVLADPAAEVLAAGCRLVAPGQWRTPEMHAGDGAIELAVVAGLDAGGAVHLPRGIFSVRPPRAASGVGWLIEIDLPPLATPAAPWHQHGSTVETVVCEDFVLAVSKPIESEPAAERRINRPPRPLLADPVVPIEVAEPPSLVADPLPLSWATLLAPIPIALLMAFFFRPIFALFAAMGPLLALGRWYENRRRYRRQSAERTRRVVAARAQVARQVQAQAETMAQLRWLEAPHVSELWRRARSRSVRLWERRPASHGFLQFTLAVGPDRDDALVGATRLHDEIHRELRVPVSIRPVPHVVDLVAHQGVGVAGARPQTLAIARSVVLQLATLQGPADLRIGVLCQPETTQDWEWMKWLPHADPTIATTTAAALVEELVRGQAPPRPVAFDAPDNPGVVHLIVVDDSTADVAALSRAAHESSIDLRVLAVAPLVTLLPAICTVVAHVGSQGVELVPPRSVELSGAKASPICPVGVSMATAENWARSLARLIDPELERFTGSDMAGPGMGISGLSGLVEAGPIEQRWSECSVGQSIEATIGTSGQGPFVVDLAADGPHALVAGTTGSGKSEFLRTFVISLALGCSPERLNFVLVDFKGGGAFDACERLPHVVGVITDLDEFLVDRALRSLRAELQRREVLFRELRASDFGAAERAAREPLARLVVVIDEFAALASDYPELMTAVIDLAARGRSLGMHLILATQRPSGVVDQRIRANTNIRVALRVQDAYDSQDVIGIADAANIDRRMPGRAFVRVGGDPAIEVQTAYCGVSDRRLERCAVRNHSLFRRDLEVESALSELAGTEPRQTEPRQTEPVQTERDVLVEAIDCANASQSFSARALWSDPLPVTLDWIDLGARLLAGDRAEGGRAEGDLVAGDRAQGAQAEHAHGAEQGLVLGIEDVPSRQAQPAWRWNLDQGGLLLYGASARCAGKALVSLGVALASADGPERTHLYVIDGDAGAIAPLDQLGHTGAYVQLGDNDRIDRTIRFVESTLADRQAGAPTSSHRVVLIIDNLAAVLAGHDDVAAAALLDRLEAVARDGAPQGIHLAISARTVRDVSHRLAQQMPRRLVMALADPSGYVTLGLRSNEVVPLPEMRAIDLTSRHAVQLVEPPPTSSVSAVGPTVDPGKLPQSIRAFGSFYDARELPPASHADNGVLRIPIGIESRDLEVVELLLRPGEHALIASSAGMGRTTALRTIAFQLGRSQPAMNVCWVKPGDTLDRAAMPGPTVVLIDDAGRLDQEMTATMVSMLERPDLTFVIATTPESARSPRSWWAQIAGAGTGLLLGGVATDGDVFRARRGHVDGLGVVEGRGHLFNRGVSCAIQISAPPGDASAPC